MLVEMLVATGLVAVVIGSSIVGMLQANREAAAYRALTAARIVVERNIEYALAVSFDSTTTPTILQITSAAGAVYDDDGGGDNLVNLLVQNADGTSVVLKGTLTRTVIAEPNPLNATVRRVTFRLDFNFRGRDYSTSMTTLRAIDDV